MPVASLLYAHGFISSPDSAKVHLLRAYLAIHHPAISLVVPALSPKPAQAMATLQEALAGMPGPVGLLGSSMGGFYCAWLAQVHGLAAWLVNPLARTGPYLPDYLGEHRHAYTGESFTIDQHDAEILRRWEVERFDDPSRILVMVQTGDAVLDYRDAFAAWPGTCRVRVEGGDHHFINFDRWLPFGLRFFGLHA